MARLAALSALDYDQVREAEAERLNVRVTTLDKVVDGVRRQAGEADSDAVDFLTDPEPWPVPVNGVDLLDRLTAMVKSYLVLPSGAAETMAMWVLFAHAHDCFGMSPVLGITSPTPECGKTTTLTVLGALVPRPCFASNITVAALFRAVEKWQPTLLIDEADTFLRSSDEMRGVLNSGHQRSCAFVIRTVGDDHEPRRFRTWSPKAVALIGKLPPTLASRAIHIELRRKKAGENVRPLRADRLDHLQPLLRQAARWVADNDTRLRSMDPEIPVELSGRAADNWRPLIAIADLVGGEWPVRARGIAWKLSGRRDEQTANIMLLEDIQRIFSDEGIDRIPSQELAAKLAKMEDRPWIEWRQGKPITPRQIAKLLEPFKVTPGNIRTASGISKGYMLDDLTEAFGRYVSDSSATPLQYNDINELWSERSATSIDGVADEIKKKPNDYKACSGVADQKPPQGHNGHLQTRSPRSDRHCLSCGDAGKGGDELLEAWVGSDRSWLHRRCLPAWTE